MAKKLTLETKIRDAAVSLSRVNASHKKVSKQSEEQLEAANRRVEAAQKELWRVSDRANDVSRKLLEHRAAVLSLSVRSMEKKMAPGSNGNTAGSNGRDSGYDSAQMSPSGSSVTSISSSSRFDGAHLFAGHADAIVPKARRSAGEIDGLEDKLKKALEALADAEQKEAELSRELSLMRLEKQEVETSLSMELQNAEDTIHALETELPRLEGLDSEVQELLEEKKTWEEERKMLEGRLTAGTGSEKLSAEAREQARKQLEEKDEEIRQMKAQWETERENWENEKAEAEDDRMEDMARLQEEMDRLRAEDADALENVNRELNEALAVVRTLVQTHNIPLFSRDTSLPGLLGSVGTHLATVGAKVDSHSKAQTEWESLRRKLEDDLRAGLDKRESLVRELEEARREREVARKESRTLETRVTSLKVCDLFGNSSCPLNIACRTKKISLPAPRYRPSRASLHRQTIPATRLGSYPSSIPSGQYSLLQKPVPQNSPNGHFALAHPHPPPRPLKMVSRPSPTLTYVRSRPCTTSDLLSLPPRTLLRSV